MKSCIVSFGKGCNFERGIDRLEENIKNLVKVSFFGYKDYPTGCPTHDISPFAFKFYCIKECLNKGYNNILWLDSSVIIKNSLIDVFNFIENTGYFFIQNSHSVGEYCHDKALKTLNITREDSFKIPSLQGTNFGLNFTYKSSLNFLNEMILLSKDGITFPGSSFNDNFECSKDKRVSGHRHEQTAMSVIALKLQMNKWFTTEEHPWFIHDRNFVKTCNSTCKNVNMCL